MDNQPQHHHLGFQESLDREEKYMLELEGMFPDMQASARRETARALITGRRAAIDAIHELEKIVEQIDVDSGNGIIALRRFAEHAGYSNGVQGHVASLFVAAGNVDSCMRTMR